MTKLHDLRLRRGQGKRSIASESIRELKRTRRYIYNIPYKRPKTFKQCPDGPCPYVSCRYHLFLDVSESTGTIKYNFPTIKNPLDLPEPCVLRIADNGGCTLEEIGIRMNVSRERINQIEKEAIEKVSKLMIGLTPNYYI